MVATVSGASLAPAALLRRNALVTLVAHVLFAAAQWGLLVALARLTDPGAVGRFTLALAIVAPVFVLAGMQLRGLLASDPTGQAAPGVYLALRIATSVLALAVVVVVALAGSHPTTTTWVILAVAAARAVESISDMLHGFLHLHERLDIIAGSLVTRGVAGLGAFAAVLAVTRSVAAATGSLVVVAVLVLLLVDVPAVRRCARHHGAADPTRPLWRGWPMVRLTWVALPLGVVMALLALSTAIPRYVVEAELGTEALGIFAALAYVMLVLSPIAGAIGQAMLPRLARDYASGDRRAAGALVRRVLVIAVVLGLVGVGVAVVGGDLLLSALYGPGYAGHGATFVLVMVAGALSAFASLGGFTLTAARFLRSQVFIQLASVLVVLALSLALVPRLGIEGGAWALVGATAVQAGGNLALVARSLRDPQAGPDRPGADVLPPTDLPAGLPGERPLRVLHVIGSLERGGAETWLRHLCVTTDPAEARLEVVTHRPGDGAYGAELREHGIPVTTLPLDRGGLAYARALHRHLREAGPFDVVHSHVHHFSGVVLTVAALAGVPVRVAHAHSDTATTDRASAWPRRAYLALMRLALRAGATSVLAASVVAGTSLVGGRVSWVGGGRHQILRCAIDLSPYRRLRAPAEMRRDLGVAPESVLLGHVGRFDPVKNHAFLLEVTAAALAREPRVRLLLVGDGHGRAALETQAHSLGLKDVVIFAGQRDDVADLLGALDVFVMPSRYEGLPLVAIEAQAAGVPLVLADTITTEAVVDGGQVTYLSLDDPVQTWAETALAASRAPGSGRPRALGHLTGSAFDVERGARELVARYRSDLSSAG